MDEQEQMKYLHEVFDTSLPRHGPGDDASTLKALQIVLSTLPQPTKPEDGRWRVLDLGCGAGAQTMVLARHLCDAVILAVDNHQPYLDELRRRAEAQGIGGNIVTRLADMRTWDPGQQAFDTASQMKLVLAAATKATSLNNLRLHSREHKYSIGYELIWSEGALYCMGFLEGLKACHRWLVPNGFLAVTELCWLKSGAPAECREFFDSCYPAISRIEDNLQAMRDNGYRIVNHFPLPESAWRDRYYRPLEQRLMSLRQQPISDPGALEMVAFCEMEIEMYRRYAEYYGYVFYILQR